MGRGDPPAAPSLLSAKAGRWACICFLFETCLIKSERELLAYTWTYAESVCCFMQRPVFHLVLIVWHAGSWCAFACWAHMRYWLLVVSVCETNENQQEQFLRNFLSCPQISVEFSQHLVGMLKKFIEAAGQKVDLVTLGLCSLRRNGMQNQPCRSSKDQPLQKWSQTYNDVQVLCVASHLQPRLKTAWFICNFGFFGKNFREVVWRFLSCFSNRFRSIIQTKFRG